MAVFRGKGYSPPGMTRGKPPSGRPNAIDLRMNFPSDAEIKEMFNAVPQLERYRVSDRVVRAGAKPVVKRARQLAPRSSAADRAKRSKSQRNPDEKGNSVWDYPLWKTIKYVIRKYGNAAGLAVIGPEWPKGNKAYFNTSPSGRVQVLWGKRTGKVIPQIRNWIVQAFDETKGDQLRAMKAELKRAMDKIWT